MDRMKHFVEKISKISNDGKFALERVSYNTLAEISTFFCYLEDLSMFQLQVKIKLQHK